MLFQTSCFYANAKCLETLKDRSLNFASTLIFTALFMCLAVNQAKSQIKDILIENYNGRDVCGGRAFLSGVALSNKQLNKIANLLSREIKKSSLSSVIAIERYDEKIYLIRTMDKSLSTKKVFDSFQSLLSKSQIFFKHLNFGQNFHLEPDFVIRADSGTMASDSLVDDWWMENTGVKKLWDLGIKGSVNTVVAVLDSGIDLNNSSLRIWNPKISYVGIGNGTGPAPKCLPNEGRGFNYIPGENICIPNDRNGHGTKVAGIVGANGGEIKGVNWQVTILPVKVLDSTGELGCMSFAINGIKSVIYAKTVLGVNVRVINNSYGESGGDLAGEGQFNALNIVAQQAAAADILMVASAGNKYENIDDNGKQRYPASLNVDNLISVAATTQKDEKFDDSSYSEAFSIGAPGDNILTTGIGNKPVYFSKTSAAAPFVSGAAALLFSQCPSLKYEEVKNALLNHGEDPSGKLTQLFKYGRINVYKAYQEITGNSKCKYMKPVP